MPNQPTTSGSQYTDYRGRDRHGMAVAVLRDGRPAVAGGPERIDAFAGETVRFKLVNATGHPVTFELTMLKQFGSGPADPFEEGPRETYVGPNLSAERKPELVLELKASEAFKEKPTRYEYAIRIKGDPKSGLDPELDVWP
jgi:hypothetical protein